MITIELDKEKKIKIPQSWTEVILRNYEKWFDFEPNNRLEQVKYIAGICNIEEDMLLESPTQIFDIIVENINFLFDDLQDNPSNSIKIT